MKQLSIWGTFEMDCASRSFSYEQYCNMHKEYKLIGSPLSEKGYKRVNQIITEAIEDDFLTHLSSQEQNQHEVIEDEFE